MATRRLFSTIPRKILVLGDLPKSFLNPIIRASHDFSTIEPYTREERSSVVGICACATRLHPTIARGYPNLKAVAQIGGKLPFTDDGTRFTLLHFRDPLASRSETASETLLQQIERIDNENSRMVT